MIAKDSHKMPKACIPKHESSNLAACQSKDGRQ